MARRDWLPTVMQPSLTPPSKVVMEHAFEPHRSPVDILAQRRRAVMALTARATATELEQALDRIGRPVFVEIRPPQIGLVMLRGRTGGDGAPFNLGEATVTRAAVRLETGEIGIAYALGRGAAKARLAAIIDGLAQRGTDGIDQALAPVEHRIATQAATADARTAATRVDFFTLVRGED